MARHKLPDYIHCFGKDIPIIVKTIGDGHEAEYDREANEILICETYAYDKATTLVKIKQTIIHELVHYLFERTGIRQGDVSEEIEEVIADNVGTGIIEAFDVRFKF